MMKRLFFLIGLLAALTVTSCDPPNNDYVTIPANDPTAPTTALDAFLDSGTVSVTSASGSQVSASVGNQGQIALIASGKDEDGGVQDAQIWYNTTITTCDASGVCTKRGPGLAGAPAASNPDSPKSPGSSASKSRLVNYTLDIAALRTRTTTSISVEIWAVAVNFHGLKTQTPLLTLNWP